MRMMKMKLLSLGLIAALTLSACAQPYGNQYGGGNGGYGGGNGGGIDKATIGALGGAAAGGIVGSNIGKGKGAIAATIIGTLIGAGIGNEIGASLDRADMAYANNTSQRALETAPTGQQMAWQNPDSGHSGYITPTNTYQNEYGQYCREYTQRIVVGGQSQEGYGRACRQPNGSWQIVQ